MMAPTKKPKAEVRPIVIIVEREGDSREYEFKQDAIIIGSGPTANLTFSDDSVSSLHAVIKLTMETATLVDLGSETSTFVNGKQVREIELKDGDTVRVGRRQFVVQLPPVPLTVADDSEQKARSVKKPNTAAAPATEFERTVQSREPTVASRSAVEAQPTARKPAVEAGLSVAERPTRAAPATTPNRGKASARPTRPDSSRASPVATAKSTNVMTLPMEPTDLLPRARDRLPDLEGRIVADVDANGVPRVVWQRASQTTEPATATAKTLEVAVYWGDELLEVRHFDRPGDITIGSSRQATIRLASESFDLPAFPLLRSTVDGVAVAVLEQLPTIVRADGKFLDQDEMKRRQLLEPSGAAHKLYRLRLGDAVAVRVGSLTLAVQYVRPATVSKSPWAERLDQAFVATMFYVLLFALFSAVMVGLAPANEDVQQDDLFKNAARFAKLILTDKKPPQKKFELSGAKNGGHRRDDDGRFGKRDVKKDASASAKGAARIDPNKRENDRKIALNSGILGALKGGKADAMANVFGPGGLGTGINSALGGLHGQQMSDAGGLSSLGSRGTGPGAAGNSVGIGGLGKNGGTGESGAGNIDLGGRGKSEHAVEHGQTIVQGALSQEAIARVLGRAQSQMRYCYEKELQRIPDLNGKITTKFTIGGTGAVTDANIILTTMNNSNVEECLLRVFKRLRFPQPAGGGEVDVSYPLIYKPTGAD